ncbi:carbonic anhydrase [Methylomarinum sp. Ch1-1]|uniref:Carbonic anhydrase n=1 Tax=Methylomarinum roseum TaxID=3067653 RepID=A0AAU7NRD9_9GAMM|nr:carbonic anhydrase [Methylomarinum sp. Ch1-1]MDP4520458.1 carbonic anhydrase [Methylomarinum sp. Ch1-1]
MESFEKLLQQNKQWSSAKKEEDPHFFSKLSNTQKPEFLWIGCSDSRVPAEIIVNAEPGEIFIHRNIANQVIHTDFNCLSVLQYAVNVLKVKHIIVCGHYNCGGVHAALQKQSSNSIITNKWLMHLKNTYRLHQHELDIIENKGRQVNRLVELNIIEQVNSLAHTSIVQRAWRGENGPIIHGWVYGLQDGLLNPLITLSPNEDLIHPIFQYEAPDFEHLEHSKIERVMNRDITGDHLEAC